MKRIIVLGICLLFLTACAGNNGTNNENDMPAITGEIVEIADGSFLVESTEELLPNGNIKMIWFTTDDNHSLKVGQIVSVWADAIRESYPAQADAVKIEIIE